MIEVEGLRKEFGETVAVAGVDFTARGGEIFGLLGPNGAGKSTTIGCVSGLLAPSGGRVRVLGHDVVHESVQSRTSLGVVPQELALYEDLSAQANLVYWGQAYGLRGKELDQRVTEVLEAVGLLDRSKEEVKKYSGGMKRRLNFACGIVHRPKVLLLDEPTVGVDPQSRVRLIDLVRAQAAAGTCVLYTTHYMEEAQDLCDVVGIIDHGKVIALGTLEELRDQVGGRDLLRLAGNFDEAAASGALARIDGLEVASVEADALRVSMPEASRHLPEIFRALESAGCEVRETTLTQPSLESLFIALTGARAAGVAVRFLLDSARKDLLRRLKDPLALLLWFGIPLVIGSLVGLGMGGSSSTPTAHVLLVDQDDSFLSQFIAGARGQDEVDAVIDVEPVELEEGMERIEAGEASALVVLPEGFADALLKNEPATIQLITNPAQRILPGIVQEGLELLVEAAFYAQRILGEPIRELAEGPPDGAEFFADAVIASASGEINARVRRLEGTLFPPVLKLETGAPPGLAATPAEEEDEPAFNFGILFVPGLLFMALLFIAQGVIEDLWNEKEAGTLRRVLTTPHSLTTFLAGKLLAGATLMAVATLVGLVIVVVVFDIPISATPAALVWATFVGTALLALFFLLQFFASSRRGANVLTSAVIFPLMMLGGSFFPFEAMPDWMVAVGRWTPNGMGLVVMKEILRQELTAGSLVVPTLTLSLMAIAAVLISERLLRRRFLFA